MDSTQLRSLFLKTQIVPIEKLIFLHATFVLYVWVGLYYKFYNKLDSNDERYVQIMFFHDRQWKGDSSF